jgi:hypothetical protein
MIATIPLVDVRHRQVEGHRKTRLDRRGITVQREPRAITGIVIHQTAVRYGVSDAQLDAAGGDRTLALARRGLEVACHAIAFRDGFFAAVHKLTSYVHHGNAFNAFTLGLEIDGRYPGLRDDPSTTPKREDLETVWGGEPDGVTSTIVDCARAALRWLVEEGRRSGMPLTNIYAHRQSSTKRRSDPGQELWERVVLEYAVPELGLRTHPLLSIGNGKTRGRPIPRAWDPTGQGPY